MTENEAIKILYTENRCLGKANSGRCKINCGDCKENIPIAYQEKAYEVAISALKEIQQYREIGTVEECREAVEKQRPMKVTDIHVDEYFCPSCGAENNCDQGIVRDRYCPNCGQRIGIGG